MAQYKTPVFTEKVLLAIVGAILTMSTLYSSYMTIKINHKTEVNTAKIDTLHQNMNGKMELLLEANKAAAHAEGKLEQIAVQDSIENK